jgi:N-acetylglucosaminyl-diphospho-decaprenol L-rhamnosyltransferase
MASLHLSVVVPTHDTRDLTLRCLAALARAPAVGAIVVVDDGSRDETAAAVAAQFPAVDLVTIERARGFTAAANMGLARALALTRALPSGGVLLLLNSDTEIAPDVPARLLDAFAARPRLGAAGAALVFPDGRPQWSGGRLPDARWLFALASGLAAGAARVPGYRRVRPVAGHGGRAVEWVPGTAMALRAEAWRAVGPFDGRLRLYAQDLDVCWRMRDVGWEVAVIEEARVLHHGGATIGALPGATTDRQDPELLWTDLVRVVAAHRGVAGAAAAVRALRRGAALRIACRHAFFPLVARTRRATWRHDTQCYVRARAALA